MHNTLDEMQAFECWIDLNCPLWGDYQHRDERIQGKAVARANPEGFSVDQTK